MVYNEKLIVVIKSNGKVLREFNNEVHIPFGSDYSIFIKNKDRNRKALVNINIDGKDVLDNNSLIIDPNTDAELKGFMSSTSVKNKFRFIEKTSKVSTHRGNNVEDGLVEVTYRFEEFRHSKCEFYTNNMNMSWYTPRYFMSNFDDAITPIATAYCVANSVISTDGITVKGKETSQDFINGDIGNLESLTYTIILKLKGKVPFNTKKTKLKTKKVRNPITVKTKLQCTSCGRHWKSNIKFCGDCGTYLN